MKKKLLSFLLCVVMVAAMVVALAACGEKYDFVIWVGEGMKELTAQQIDAFNETSTLKLKAKIEIQSEKNAVGAMTGKPKTSWPDVYCFAQDQLATAINGGMLHTLNDASKAFIQEHNSDETIAAATVGDRIRAYPMTADNGYFMYYDTRVITNEAHLTSLEDLIADCKAAGKKFSMKLATTGGAWYAAAFFHAVGLESNWTIDNTGTFTGVNDTFHDQKGVIALQGIQKLFEAGTNVYQDSDSAEDFNAGTPSAVVISGIWDYNNAKKALGDNLGIASLPKFTVDGEEYQLRSYIGHKFMGIKPQTDAERSKYLQNLAMYLTSAECQKARYDLSKWGPSDKSLSELTSPALTALKATATVNQGQYPDGWWPEVVLMTDTMKKNSEGGNTDDAAALKVLLDSYYTKISALVKA